MKKAHFTKTYELVVSGLGPVSWLSAKMGTPSFTPSRSSVAIAIHERDCGIYYL